MRLKNTIFSDIRRSDFSKKSAASAEIFSKFPRKICKVQKWAIFGHFSGTCDFCDFLLKNRKIVISLLFLGVFARPLGVIKVFIGFFAFLVKNGENPDFWAKIWNFGVAAFFSDELITKKIFLPKFQNFLRFLCKNIFWCFLVFYLQYKTYVFINHFSPSCASR